MEKPLKDEARLILVGSHTVSDADLTPPEMCLTVKHISIEQIEAGIESQLAEEEFHRHQRALSAMRAGALFYCLKCAMEVSGRKYTGFWAHCENRFGVTRGTISRKMTLVARWASKNGGNKKLITQLAKAAQLDPAAKNAPKAVQLAFKWIDGLDLSDVYRRERLVNYGPQNTGKLLGDPKKGRHTGENIQLKKQAEAGGAAATLGEFLDEFLNNKIYEQLTDADLQHLRERVVEFETVVSNLALARKLKRLPDNWRLLESQP